MLSRLIKAADREVVNLVPWSDDRQDSESAHPPLKQSIHAVVVVVMGYGFRPLRSSGHDSEQVVNSFLL
jgi:hypothetical protein